MESALDLRGGSAEAHQQAIARHPAHLQAVCPQLRAHGADRLLRGRQLLIDRVQVGAMSQCVINLVRFRGQRVADRQVRE